MNTISVVAFSMQKLHSLLICCIWSELLVPRPLAGEDPSPSAWWQLRKHLGSWGLLGLDLQPRPHIPGWRRGTWGQSSDRPPATEWVQVMLLSDMWSPHAMTLGFRVHCFPFFILVPVIELRSLKRWAKSPALQMFLLKNSIKQCIDVPSLPVCTQHHWKCSFLWSQDLGCQEDTVGCLLELTFSAQTLVTEDLGTAAESAVFLLLWRNLILNMAATLLMYCKWYPEPPAFIDKAFQRWPDLNARWSLKQSSFWVWIKGRTALRASSLDRM